MPCQFEIACANEVGVVVDEQSLLRTARLVLEGELDEPAEMSFVLVDDARIQQLNRDWRGFDEPTDVLSFGLSARSKPALEEEEPFPFPQVAGEMLHLGEVVVSLPTAERQAGEQNRPVEAELRHLLIHGVLHLLGYDHAEPDEEAAMRLKEQRYLADS